MSQNALQRSPNAHITVSMHARSILCPKLYEPFNMLHEVPGPRWNQVKSCCFWYWQVSLSFTTSKLISFWAPSILMRSHVYRQCPCKMSPLPFRSPGMNWNEGRCFRPKVHPLPRNLDECGPSWELRESNAFLEWARHSGWELRAVQATDRGVRPLRWLCSCCQNR